MCHEVTYPSTLSGDVQHELVSLARRIADHVEAEGVLAVEFFIVGESCLVNELAPRPHNSGHLTIEGSITSQFANHLTGVMDRALGDTSMAHPHVAMVNIVGGPNCDGLQRDSGLYGFDTASVHMYGKTPRPGRKLGHATAWGDDAASAIATAREFASRYTPDR